MRNINLMQLSDSSKDILKIQKIVWAGLAGSVLILIFVYQNKHDFTAPVSTPSSLADFGMLLFIGLWPLLCIALKSKIRFFVKPVDILKAPITKNVPSEDSQYMRLYPRYFFYHLLVWIGSDFLVVTSFAYSLLHNNFFYLACAFCVFLITHFLFYPNYEKFMNE